MGDLWLFLLLPLPLAAFLGVKGCLECDPRFIKDIQSLLAKLVPSEVPGRTELLDRQIKAMPNLSCKVSHGNKMLRVLAVQRVVYLRTWLKNELYKVSNKTWKGVFILQGKLLDVRQSLESKLKEVLKHFSEAACSEDCVLNEGPILDCWSCHQITTHCFKGEYCGDENSNKGLRRQAIQAAWLLQPGGPLALSPTMKLCRSNLLMGLLVSPAYIVTEEDSRKHENREIGLFLILITEAVILGSALLLLHVCVTHQRKMKAIRKSLENYVEKKLEELMGRTDKKNKQDFGIRK